MANFNKVLLMGNLTKDPELRYTPQGVAVVNLRLAVNRRFRDRNQEVKDEVCFVTCVVWDKQAETCNQYLKKGSPVFIEGRLQSRSWEDNSGQKRNVLEVRAERVQFLSGAQAMGQMKQSRQASAETEQEIAELDNSYTENAWLEEESEEKGNES